MAKGIAFFLVILCFTSALTIFTKNIVVKDINLGIALENNYFGSENYISDANLILDSLRQITQRYKSEEHILQGGALPDNDRLKSEENHLFWDFQSQSKNYNPNLTPEENYQIFKDVYAQEIAQIKDRLIAEDLQAYKSTLRRLEEFPGLIYYAKSGETEFTNSPNPTKDHFKTFPSYIVLDGLEQVVFPEEIIDNPYYSWLTSYENVSFDQNRTFYIAFSEDFINPRMEEWKANKLLITNALYEIAGFLAGLAIALIYLIRVIGRKPEEDREVHLHLIDRIFVDINLFIICPSLIALWVATIIQIEHFKAYELIFPVTLAIASFGLIFVLSLIKHLKNKTFLRHTLIYTLFHKLFKFIRDIYDSGSIGVKVVIIVIGYPVLVALTFFMFPLTLGFAAWVALKKVREFKAIKEGVKKVKDGNIHYTIPVNGKGEFSQLASDINSITDGLNKAVENELKSERLKTELITNVSHDIRTPLTSIITYVDLLKKEKDPKKVEEYLEIIDQKSQRLKLLTEDLFEATKASSGNIPVNYEMIDIISLVSQGLGELDDKIQERKLDFKLSYSKDKITIRADGKLLWRAIENLLSNILKYALEGSRVYLDIFDSETEVTLILKNISAYELNISSDELMERFVRGDESRNSQGSGLGLSIAKSLIEIQKGHFHIEIDGDLFKAIIQIPKVN